MKTKPKKKSALKKKGISHEQGEIIPRTTT